MTSSAATWAASLSSTTSNAGRDTRWSRRSRDSGSSRSVDGRRSVAALVGERAEVGRDLSAGGAERNHADERPGERAVLAASRFVGEDRGIEGRAYRAPFAIQRPGELEARVVDGNRKPDRPLGRNPDRGLKREAEAPFRIIGLAAEDGQGPARRFVPADRKAVELGAVVVGRQARGLLEGMRMEVEFGLGAIDEMLLPARDQRLLEPGADRLARVEAQPAGSGGEGKDALRMRGPQPLEIKRQAPIRRERIGLAGGTRLNRRRERRQDVDHGNLAPLGEIEPAVLAPRTFLDCGLPSERRAPEALERPRAEVGMIDLAVRRLDDLSVTGAPKGRVRRILRGQEMDGRMQLIRALD